MKEAGTVAKELGLVSRITKKPVPASTVHKLLKNLIYTGDFEWGGRVYQGTHQALISRELWEQVQQVLRKRHHNRHRKVRHDFTFARLLTCGHCGCSLVGEIKKGRYIYYHCTGYKGKCPEPFVREEILEANFASLLKKLRFDGEFFRCVSQALRESHVDEKKSLTEAITRLQAEYAKIQNRIDAMYTDKLDGKIDQGFFEAKSAEWRLEQTRLLRSIESHQRASQSYLDEGVSLLELAQSAHGRFLKQDSHEKRRLLVSLLSNCSWKTANWKLRSENPLIILRLRWLPPRKKKGLESPPALILQLGVPKGIRTPVAAVKGRCPRPG